MTHAQGEDMLASAMLSSGPGVGPQYVCADSGLRMTFYRYVLPSL